MKIKFNWGTGIFIVILLFFGTMVLRIYISYQQELNLVAEDYYPKEILFQNQINKEKNTLQLAEKPIIKIEKDKLIIQFPDFFQETNNKGYIHIYRPSDAKLDKNHELNLNHQLKQTIDISAFKHGKYIVKLDWSSDDIAYYLEKEIFIFEKPDSN